MFIISLGRASGLIGEGFLLYPQYSLFKIDSQDFEKKDNNNNINIKNIPKYLTHEEYEKECPILRTFFKPILKSKIQEEILFICVGSSEITGCLLKILEELKGKKIIILYIKPDLTFINEKSKIQEKIVYNILQEYVRSGLLEKIYLFDNSTIEKVIGNLSIREYYKKINEIIVSTFHYINVFKNSKPLWETNNEDLSSGTKIVSVGIFDIEQNNEKMLFPLKYITHKIFYYAFSKKQIENDGSLILKIKDQMKIKKNEGSKISFKVYTTEYEQNISFVESFTHFIQE